MILGPKYNMPGQQVCTMDMNCTDGEKKRKENICRTPICHLTECCFNTVQYIRKRLSAEHQFAT
jgi:hypothetical protein